LSAYVKFCHCHKHHFYFLEVQFSKENHRNVYTLVLGNHDFSTVTGVIAITLTTVLRKHHMQFLTSAQNFRGSTDPPDPAFPSACIRNCFTDPF